MNYNEQWPGHGRIETVYIFQELVEATPQLPIEKIGHYAKVGLVKIGHTVKEAFRETETLPQAKRKTSG